MTDDDIATAVAESADLAGPDGTDRATLMAEILAGLMDDEDDGTINASAPTTELYNVFG